MKNISEYWKAYNNLVNSIDDNDIKDALINAQRYVNGLTDGWFGFYYEFEKVIQINEIKLTKEQLDISKFLLLDLLSALNNR
ncbi:hypothetical protein [Dysgonomonas sp. 520]|uniref:hypothetical protein n=1 Tax=Dysgonomonas sp. 520 TaxID=2302931 RepID=UPI0013D110AB|nr:hypothetical protein [Dysgonomonas sp. 520]NDW10697.1 hypothetical protein [Dysgonomonas sp. 520]